MINRALNLKQWKPGGGLHFSLQQQGKFILIISLQGKKFSV